MAQKALEDLCRVCYQVSAGTTAGSRVSGADDANGPEREDKEGSCESAKNGKTDGDISQRAVWFFHHSNSSLLSNQKST